MRREQSDMTKLQQPVNNVSEGQRKGKGQGRDVLMSFLVICCFDAADGLVSGS